MHEKDPPFADRDPFGLTADDWMCFHGASLDSYSGPAMLWWALVGVPSYTGEGEMSGYPFPDLLKTLAIDVYALAALASGSREDDVRLLGASLRNLQRRIETAAEIALRIEEDQADGHQPPPNPPPRCTMLSKTS